MIPLPQYYYCPTITALTLPASACILPRAWLSCTLLQPWRWGPGELFSCVQRGAEKRGLRTLRTRTLVRGNSTQASCFGSNSKYLVLQA